MVVFVLADDTEDVDKRAGTVDEAMESRIDGVG
jgi:hypothetical protein